MSLQKPTYRNGVVGHGVFLLIWFFGKNKDHMGMKSEKRPHTCVDIVGGSTRYRVGNRGQCDMAGFLVGFFDILVLDCTDLLHSVLVLSD